MITLSRFVAGQEVVHEKMFVHTDRNYYHTGEIIWFKIYNVDGAKFTPADISKIAYVEVIDSANKPVLQGKIALEGGRGNGSFTIPVNIPTGVYIFRGYTNWMKNFSSVYFFEKEIVVANAASGQRSFIFSGEKKPQKNSGSLVINAEPDSRQYGKRKRVSITINTNDANGKSLASDLSLSVYRLDSLVSQDPVDISSTLENASEPENPSDFPFPPEYKGHFVSGKMLDRNTRMASKFVNGYLTVMDDANSFYNARTDAKGNISFLVTKLNSADSIIVQTNSYYDREHQLEIESPFFNQYSPRKSSLFTATTGFPSTMLEQSINAQATAVYYEDKLNKFSFTRRDTTPFYYKEDMRYTLDDYTRFSKLEDVFREYVRPVDVSKRRGVFHLSVFNEVSRFIVDQEPLVLVDAVPVFDMNSLFAYDPLKVKTIDIVTSKYFKSGAVFPGIISLRTYKGRTDGLLIDPNANVLSYEIIQKHRDFYSPSYLRPGSGHLPDFRSLLYWNPSVKTDNSGKAAVEFYTSDLDGEFIIQLNGTSAGGETGSVSTSITVK
ncbi:MAG: hypothetical protein JNK79_08725 [Chitinophagaceae bacterium]|nr:hypothetical protein [Chitinophagaceae bacterium]